MNIPWGEVATGAVAGFALGWRVYDGIRERTKVRKYGLMPNPERCQRHGEAIARIEAQILGIEEDIKELKTRVG